LELLRIIMQNSQLDSLIFARSDNAKLINALSLVQPQLTTGSLAAYDGFDFNELHQFMQIFHQNINNMITGSEKFSGEMLTQRNRVSLSDATYELLVKYYNDTYDWNFVSIADLSSSGLSSVNSIVGLRSVLVITEPYRSVSVSKRFQFTDLPNRNSR
jgi:hypothetical protein